MKQYPYITNLTKRLFFCCCFRCVTTSPITVLSFPLLCGECGRRGWYDCPKSALRPRTVWPNAPATPDVCKLVCEWVVCDSARGRCVLCSRDLVAIYYSAWHRPFRFTRLTPNVYHAHSYTDRSRICPTHPSKVTRQPGAYGAVAWYIHGLTSFSVSGRHSLQLRRPYS